MRVGVVVSDLILFSRIESAALAEGAELQRVDRPQELAAELDLILVDWSARDDGWTAALNARTPVPIVLFGPHTDLEAHAAAKAAGLGPMLARSKLVSEVSRRLRERDGAAQLPEMIRSSSPATKSRT